MTKQSLAGCILLARKILVKFFERPPLHLKVWVWLLLNAVWKPETIFGMKLKRGQLLTTLGEIAESVEWRVGNSPRKPSTSAVCRILQEFSAEKMIACANVTTKYRRKILITVCNYDTYQNLNAYSRKANATHKTARQTLMEKADRQVQAQRREQRLVKLIDECWHLRQMDDKRGEDGLRAKMMEMTKAKDLPKDSMETLDEIMDLRTERT